MILRWCGWCDFDKKKCGRKMPPVDTPLVDPQFVMPKVDDRLAWVERKQMHGGKVQQSGKSHLTVSCVLIFIFILTELLEDDDNDMGIVDTSDDANVGIEEDIKSLSQSSVLQRPSAESS